MLLLLAQGEIQKSHAVECKVRDGEDATEISLTENVIREDMHPVDAYEAFSALADQGKAVPDIAARFGTTRSHRAPPPSTGEGLTQTVGRLPQRGDDLRATFRIHGLRRP